MFDENRLNWPKGGDINAWADYVETLCILSRDSIMSIEDFSDRLLDDAGKTIEEILSAINFNENFLAPLHVALKRKPIMRILPDDTDIEDDTEEEER